MPEDVLRELAAILAAAYRRYQRLRRVQEETASEAQKELASAAPESVHGQEG